jgi:hypothetical protein
MLKPQDIVVLLKLLAAGNNRPTYAQLAVDLYMSPSEVHASIRRSRTARLVHGRELGDRVNAKALAEFLVHGIRYAFPAEKGGMTRGMPTASAAEPLSRKMTQEEPSQSGRSSKAPSGATRFCRSTKKHHKRP